MRTTKAKSGFSKLRITHLAMILAALVCGGGYGWHVYSLFRDAQLNMPQLQIEKLAKDLNLFHSRIKRFPHNFAEINAAIWHTQPKPDYGADGRQARTRNYYYFYTRVKDNQCAIWAIPLGPRRHYASTFFLVLAPEWRKVWKGGALEEAAIQAIPAIPSTDELVSLRMHEIPAGSRVATAGSIGAD